MYDMKILVTGGAGFIGSAVVRYIINNTEHKVVNIDSLTYAGNLESVNSISENTRYSFQRVDISDREELKRVFDKHQPSAIMHLAAESHVDRSIVGPTDFIQTNIVGTYNMLEESRAYWSNADEKKKKKFRFHHISTDEVYGDLGKDDDLFTESTPYSPSSPYSASKAAADHLVRAWHRTYNMPVIISNCSNNYGPYHFPEKLIPLAILNAIKGSTIPIYGSGDQVRDWLYVEDHATALFTVLTKGVVGETYNIGGNNEKTNLEVVHSLCDVLQELKPCGYKYKNLIKHVIDRPGHDRRYAINASKIERELGWKPMETFETGIRKTVQWYLKNSDWWQKFLDGNHKLTNSNNK